LDRGETYHLYTRDDVADPILHNGEVNGKLEVDVTVLSESSAGSFREVSGISAKDARSGPKDLLGRNANVNAEDRGKEFVVHPVSALDIILKATGHSQVARLINSYKYEVKHVEMLPPKYDGNIVFELPPVVGSCKKGLRLQGMDRANDCYFWNRIAPTTVKVPTKLYEFGMVKCLGALECQNNQCDFFVRGGAQNVHAWGGVWTTTALQKVGEILPAKSVVCGYCNETPCCVSQCQAQMCYICTRTLSLRRS